MAVTSVVQLASTDGEFSKYRTVRSSLTLRCKSNLPNDTETNILASTLIPPRLSLKYPITPGVDPASAQILTKYEVKQLRDNPYLWDVTCFYEPAGLAKFINIVYGSDKFDVTRPLEFAWRLQPAYSTSVTTGMVTTVTNYPAQWVQDRPALNSANRPYSPPPNYTIRMPVVLCTLYYPDISHPLSFTSNETVAGNYLFPAVNPVVVGAPPNNPPPIVVPPGRYVPFWPRWYVEMDNSVNDGAWNGFSARNVKLELNVTAELDETENLVWKVTFRFCIWAIKNETWDVKLLDAGYEDINGRIKRDSFDKTPVGTPWPLDGAGSFLPQQVASTGTPPTTLPTYVYNSFTANKPINFTTLMKKLKITF